MENKPKTLKEALDQGYIIVDRKYQRGYISRKINEMDQTIKVAGGRRAGDLYIKLPCYKSTQYFFRAYLKK